MPTLHLMIVLYVFNMILYLFTLKWIKILRASRIADDARVTVFTVAQSEKIVQ